MCIQACLVVIYCAVRQSMLLPYQMNVQLAKEHGYNCVAASRTFTCTSIW